MPRKYGRSAYDYDDEFDDYYDDFDDEEDATSSAVKNLSRASGLSELGKALFSPLPEWKLKRASGSLPFQEFGSTMGGESVFFNPRGKYESLLVPATSAENIGVVPFKFDTPSPDDRVRTSQSGTKTISARLPSVPSATKSVVRKSHVADKTKDLVGQVESQLQSKDPAESSELRTKDVVEQVEIQQRKSRVSAESSELSSRANGGSLEFKPNLSQEGVESIHIAGKSEAQGLEDFMHMTLDGVCRERGKGIEQSFANPRKQPAVDTYVPEPWILEEIKTQRKPLLHLIVIGHVDAGKSTLMGHVLHLLGRVSQKEMHKNERESKQKGKGSFAYAWVLDEGSEERARGVTMTVAVAHFETPKLRVVLLDAPGHKDFVPNMISGAAQADAAVLVIDASLGAFEAGLEGEGHNGGQTREHAQLVRSLGVEQLIVVVNKMDAVNYSQQRYNFIKGSLQPFLRQCGFKESAIRWIPVSAIDGQNLTAPPSAAPLISWYQGSTFLECVDLFDQPLRSTLKPLRLVIAEQVKSRSLGQAGVSGKLESGAMRVGNKVLVMPIGEVAIVKCIEQEGKALNAALAGDSVDVGLTGVEPGVLAPGGVLCHPDYAVPVAIRLEVRVLTLGITVPILRGGQVVLHAHHAKESAQIADLVALLDSKTGTVIKKKPRCLTANQSALIEITPERSLCVEEYSRFKALGRIAIRDVGRTLAVGIVTRIVSQQNKSD